MKKHNGIINEHINLNDTQTRSITHVGTVRLVRQARSQHYERSGGITAAELYLHRKPENKSYLSMGITVAAVATSIIMYFLR